MSPTWKMSHLIIHFQKKKKKLLTVENNTTCLSQNIVGRIKWVDICRALRSACVWQASIAVFSIITTGHRFWSFLFLAVLLKTHIPRAIIPVASFKWAVVVWPIQHVLSLIGEILLLLMYPKTKQLFYWPYLCTHSFIQWVFMEFPLYVKPWNSFLFLSFFF